jgi:NAD(P)-dependent dehydrogenase (short-subunit alcohol dehydrogenase family)
MQDALGYESKSVLVTGTASGMGAAVAQILVDLGANVTGLDVKPTDVPVSSQLEVDLRDPTAINDAVGALSGPIDSVFSCAGLPGPPFSELDTMLVNFVGSRHLIESLVPAMAASSSIGCISSAAAIGWEQHLPTISQLLAIDTFDGQRAWLEANDELWSWSGYAFSKYVIDAWVALRGSELIDHGIRLNCINPGPTETQMLPAFKDFAGDAIIDSAIGPIDRYSTAEEQAWPLVLLNSSRMSYVVGETLWTDGGFHAAVGVGKHGGIGSERA